jgi:DNA-binding MarR family transcriptional regulator
MSELRTQTLEALRHYAVRYQESAHRFAAWMDLPMSDGAALGEVIWAENEGDPLSAARLRWRIGMTSGATNALVKRLEERGLVTRTRESADRRIVTLRATDAARHRADGYFGARAQDLEVALGRYDDRTLEVVREFLDRLAAVLPGDPGRTADPEA